MKRNVAPGANLFGVRQPMLLQSEFLLPFEKVESIIPRFLYHFLQFGVRDFAEFA
jgi:hypothetical protein